MSKTIIIISSNEITEKELVEFLSQQGAEVNGESGFEGQITEGECHIWVGIDQTVSQHLKEGERPELLNLVKSKLGKEPQTSIVVEISRKAGSEQLAVRFIAAFVRHWQAVVNYSLDRIYSANEIFELERAGIGFISVNQLKTA